MSKAKEAKPWSKLQWSPEVLEEVVAATPTRADAIRQELADIAEKLLAHPRPHKKRRLRSRQYTLNFELRGLGEKP